MDDNGNDLILELAVCHCLLAFLLAFRRKSIELFTGQLPLFRYVLGGDHHVVIIECIPERILDHEVNQLAVIHTVAVTAVHHRVRTLAHVFHTACYDDVRIAGDNHLGSHVDAVESASADNVDGYGRAFNGESRFDRSLTGRVLAKASLDDVSHVDMVNLFGFDTGAVQRLPDHKSTEICCRYCTERTAHLSDRRAAGAC